MEGPGPAHFIFIPVVLLLGTVIGFILGSRSAQSTIEKRRKRSRQ